MIISCSNRACPSSYRCICLSIYLSIYLHIYISNHQSTHEQNPKSYPVFSFTHSSIYPSSVYQSTRASAFEAIVSFHQNANLSICLYLHIRFNPAIYRAMDACIQLVIRLQHCPATSIHQFSHHFANGSLTAKATAT